MSTSERRYCSKKTCMEPSEEYFTIKGNVVYHGDHKETLDTCRKSPPRMAARALSQVDMAFSLLHLQRK